MFASTINAVNGVNAASTTTNAAMAGVAKRSKVCDADASGKVNPNCLR